jgi:hypothetical protein
MPHRVALNLTALGSLPRPHHFVPPVRRLAVAEHRGRDKYPDRLGCKSLRQLTTEPFIERFAACFGDDFLPRP